MGNIVGTTLLLLFGSGAIPEINAMAKSGAGLPQSMQWRWLPCPHAGLEGASRRSWASSCMAWGTEPCWVLGGWLATRTSGLRAFTGFMKYEVQKALTAVMNISIPPTLDSVQVRFSPPDIAWLWETVTAPGGCRCSTLQHHAGCR